MCSLTFKTRQHTGLCLCLHLNAEDQYITLLIYSICKETVQYVHIDVLNRGFFLTSLWKHCSFDREIKLDWHGMKGRVREKSYENGILLLTDRYSEKSAERQLNTIILTRLCWKGCEIIVMSGSSHMSFYISTLQCQWWNHRSAVWSFIQRSYTLNTASGQI